MANTVSDTSEFEEMLSPHLDGLMRTAKRLASGTADAEDLVQETLLRGFRFFHRFERGSNFRAWIFKILTNTFVNLYRARRRSPNRNDADLDETPGAETSDSAAALSRPTFSMREKEILEFVDDRIKQAILELPESLRLVFMLATIEDMKYREIAEILDCPVGTVMSRLFRSREMLKDRLADMAAEGGEG